jgi:predicted nucleic acid-binding protein
LIAYVDSSVLLRILFRQKDALREWELAQRVIGSLLVEVECLRSLDRLRLRGGLPDEALAARRGALLDLTRRMELADFGRSVLARAAEPFPTSLGTLDAIHLATAVLWREERGGDVVMATHDVELGTASRALGFRVVGL